MTTHDPHFISLPDSLRWWGPHWVARPIDQELQPSLELRCAFCGVLPIPGEELIGISDVLFHVDFQLCLELRRTK